MKHNESQPNRGECPRATDKEAAAAVMNAIECITTVPTESLRVTVCEGWVNLNGVVTELYQKETVEEVVSHLTGVRGVTNLIEIGQTNRNATEHVGAL